MYELWDVGSGNIIGTYPTLNDLVRTAFAMGKVNPDMNPDDLSAGVMTEDVPFEELSDDDKRWFAEGWLERNADNR